ncbi:tRNA pseudouridine(13) synthase TruD [Thalassolituus sp. LLYu03]|uniref:tRNA pseudouridine(13) synthase TruD n=1 Tax=Thalassolituus sp. LLYu03 TaxID=3421656 RepID=UPI003D2A35EC
MSRLPEWPTAYPLSEARGTLKTQNDDFRVDELPLAMPGGEGEHVWLHIEKNGANTVWIAKRLAEFAGVKEMDVGFAGMKDRNAITRQWFSVYLPKGQNPDFSQMNDAEMTVQTQARHNKKLRRGDLLGNRFVLRLRDVQGDVAAVERNLQLVRDQGVPNYFGEQRFGHDGNNIESGRAMLAGEIRVRNPSKKSIYLSAVRSLIFNEVLAERIRRGLWGQSLAGDLTDEQGQVTAPLWGRGRLATTDDALALESEVAGRYADLCDGMEHAGLKQERRAVASLPHGLSWEWQQGAAGQDLVLTFSLPAGYYATSVIREIMQTQEPERKSSDEADAVE